MPRGVLQRNILAFGEAMALPMNALLLSVLRVIVNEPGRAACASRAMVKAAAPLALFRPEPPNATSCLKPFPFRGVQVTRGVDWRYDLVPKAKTARWKLRVSSQMKCDNLQHLDSSQ